MTGVSSADDTPDEVSGMRKYSITSDSRLTFRMPVPLGH